MNPWNNDPIPANPAGAARISCEVTTSDTEKTVKQAFGMVAANMLIMNGDTSNYVMGVASVRREHYRDIKVPQGDGHHALRYTWLVNGVPVKVMVFNSDANGKMGRLVREGNANISELEWRRFKK